MCPSKWVNHLYCSFTDRHRTTEQLFQHFSCTACERDRCDYHLEHPYELQWFIDFVSFDEPSPFSIATGTHPSRHVITFNNDLAIHTPYDITCPRVLRNLQKRKPLTRCQRYMLTQLQPKSAVSAADTNSSSSCQPMATVDDSGNLPPPRVSEHSSVNERSFAIAGDEPPMSSQPPPPQLQPQQQPPSPLSSSGARSIRIEATPSSSDRDEDEAVLEERRRRARWLRAQEEVTQRHATYRSWHEANNKFKPAPTTFHRIWSKKKRPAPPTSRQLRATTQLRMASHHAPAEESWFLDSRREASATNPATNEASAPSRPSDPQADVIPATYVDDATLASACAVATRGPTGDAY